MRAQLCPAQTHQCQPPVGLVMSRGRLMETSISVTISVAEISVHGSFLGDGWDGDVYSSMASRTAAALVDAIDVLMPALARATAQDD